MNIGNIVIPHGLALAPMAGVTDRSFRALCRRYGAEYTVSEMISAKGMHFGDRKTDLLAAPYEGEKQYAIQIFGSDPAIMAESAAALVRRYRPDAIDINMGCPVRKIVSNGEGSELMRRPETASAVVSAVVNAVNVPVTVKIRAGTDSANKNAPAFAALLEHAGASAVCVHGRTRDQLYRPPVDTEIIRAVKSAVNIPVFANGGIISAADAVDMLRVTGCDGIMTARGACGRPWIFAEITAALDGRVYTPPDVYERLDVALEHTSMLIAEHGELGGIREARHHLAWYLRGLRGGATAKDKINHAVSFSEIKAVISEVASQAANRSAGEETV